MPLWIQHGWGKSGKMVALRDARLAGGAILSPANERPSALWATIESLRVGQRFEVLIDPQAFVHAIDGGFARHHLDHSLIPGAFRPGMDATEISHYVHQIIMMNDIPEIRRIVAPSPIQTFDDRWFSTALSLVRTTVQLSEKQVIASLFIREEALDNWEGALDWLDEATSLDVSGFYIVVVRTSTGQSYPRLYESTRLTTLMRLCRTLSENEYDVIIGYSDIEGLLLLASGATAFATGWSNRLRLFEESSWVPRGGQQPPRRIFSRTTLAPFTVEEAQSLSASTFDMAVGADQRAAVRTGAVSQEDAHLSYLITLAELAREVDGIEAEDERLDFLDNLLTEARTNLDRARRDLLRMPATYPERLARLQTAIRYYREVEDI